MLSLCNPKNGITLLASSDQPHDDDDHKKGGGKLSQIPGEINNTNNEGATKDHKRKLSL